MTKGTALVLAVFTAWPIVYMVFFMGVICSTLFFAILNGPASAGGFPAIFKIIVPLHFLSMLDTFALLIFYVVYLFRTEAVAKDSKALWAVVLILGNMLSMPVFWYLYIWKQLGKDEGTGSVP